MLKMALGSRELSTFDRLRHPAFATIYAPLGSQVSVFCAGLFRVFERALVSWRETMRDLLTRTNVNIVLWNSSSQIKFVGSTRTETTHEIAPKVFRAHIHWELDSLDRVGSHPACGHSADYRGPGDQRLPVSPRG